MDAGPTPAPLASPVRVLTKGASTVNWISYMGGTRYDVAYPRVLEGELVAAGWPAVVHDTSVAAEHPKEGLAAWPRDVVNFSPDAVVLHYGHMECIHLLLPRALQRHAQKINARPGPLRDPYRQRVVRPAWQLLARGQQRVAPHVPEQVFQRRARRAVLDLERLVDRALMVGGPLVLVMELTPPGVNYESWFPGMGERMAEMNRLLRAMVERVARPEVRFFETQRVIAPLTTTGVDVNPDGAHFTPAAHRLIGAALADEVATWVAAQRHLVPARTDTARSGTFGPPSR